MLNPQNNLLCNLINQQIDLFNHNILPYFKTAYLRNIREDKAVFSYSEVVNCKLSAKLCETTFYTKYHTI